MLIILSGNYNFFNLLTLTMCLSLLDDEHIYFWLRKKYTPNPNQGTHTLAHTHCVGNLH